MKNLFIYILALAIILPSLGSCTLEDFSVSPEFTQKGDIQILGAVVDFDNKNVGTKALGSEENEESLITEMSMFIFDSNGDLVTERPVVIKDYNTTPDAFMIEIGDENTQGIIGSLNGSVSGQLYKYDKTNGNLDKCKIYIVANAEHYKKTVDGIEVSIYEGIRTLGQLLDQTLPLTGFEIPRHNGKKVGFPMIGTTEDDVTFNLLDASKNQNKIATIPLRKLYSKVVVNMVINADQLVDEYIPKFELQKWSVKDSPTKVKFGADRMGYVTDWEDSQETNSATNQTIMHTASNIFEADQNDIISFTFYMPEHLVSVSNDYEYPDNISENEKQRFKPDRLANGQKATYVYIEGTYYDQHNQVKQVKYKLYLGQNNTDDFKVVRNQQLNNYVTIKGLTNSTSALGPNGVTNISVDHRVEVTNEGFAIAMERETLMDAHFEVRPVDITLSAGSSITVIVPESDRGWIAIENSQPEGTNHVEGKGVRKYFTTDLISTLATDDETDAIGPVIKFENTDDRSQKYRFWVYVDENPNVYDKTGTGKTANEGGTHKVSTTESRLGKIQFVYTDANDNTKTVNYNIVQRNLWRIWNSGKTRFYDIEYHEEYLYNYAADGLYGSTTDGMEWGLADKQISSKYDAFSYDVGWTGGSGILGSIVSWIKSLINGIINGQIKNKPKYDFYNSSVDAPDGGTVRAYKGKEFSNEIIEKLILNNDNSGKLLLNETPSSAVEYCYHKNKRDNTGNIIIKNNDDTYDESSVKWFLPSIDQIEDIVIGGYGDFDVFQDKFYWSSQPSFKPVDWTAYADLWLWKGDVTGNFFFDDITRARATKVKMINNTPEYVKSGAYDAEELWDLNTDEPTIIPIEGAKMTFDEGNRPRTKAMAKSDENPLNAINRVRCVYRTGTN